MTNKTTTNPNAKLEQELTDIENMGIFKLIGFTVRIVFMLPVMLYRLGRFLATQD